MPRPSLFPFCRLLVLAGFLAAAMALPRPARAGADFAESLKALVEASADRLTLAHTVALSKWDSGAPVEDGGREAVVIMAAISQGEAMGLERLWVAGVVRAQIEANKMVQYGLLADWSRGAAVPRHEPVDLVHDVRPQLDAIQKTMMAALAGVAPMRARKTCRGKSRRR